jgi:hypothetical protein
MDELRAAAAGPLAGGDRAAARFLRIETDYPLFLRGREPLAERARPGASFEEGR